MAKRIVAADLSNIEGRGLAFLANERWKLDGFKKYDTYILDNYGNRIPDPKKAGAFLREGPDLYNVTATSIIGGDPYAVSGKDRNVYGKVPDLALGFAGGCGALQTFAKAYGVKMEEQWPTIQANIDPSHVTKAKDNYTVWGAPKAAEMGISELEWIASETVKLAWRARHPATQKLWYALERAAVDAIRNPGEIFTAGKYLKASVRRKGRHSYLLIKLPSGRYLTYFHPRLEEKERGHSITYMGDFRRTPAAPPIWGKVTTYSGKLVENAVQAFARDVLAYNMQAAGDAGYAIVLTVHDEMITEAGGGSAEELSAIMATVPPWAEGLPLAAAGFEAIRYKKD